MVTNQQRRAAERRLLQKQLEQRRVREIRRRRLVLSGSIGGTLVVIAVVVIAILLNTGSDGGSGGAKAGAARSSSPAGATSSASTVNPGGGSAGGVPASYQGVTVKNSTNLKKEPGVSSAASTDPTKLEYKDLVVGTGKAASPSASVTVQYTGVLYKKGTQFDSSWSRGQAATFSLAQVVPGFTQGIGGTTGVPPMKVGGRRIMILPSELGYGAQANQGIPANSSLVFVVDLTKIG